MSKHTQPHPSYFAFIKARKCGCSDAYTLHWKRPFFGKFMWGICSDHLMAEMKEVLKERRGEQA